MYSTLAGMTMLNSFSLPSNPALSILVMLSGIEMLTAFVYLIEFFPIVVTPSEISTEFMLEL